MTSKRSRRRSTSSRRSPARSANESAKLKKAKDKIADKGFVEDFERRITQDMDTRVVLAKTSPLLPYTPEPNLFVDAIAHEAPLRHQVRRRRGRVLSPR